MKTSKFYKVVSTDAQAYSGGHFDYSAYLPTLNADGTQTPGEWTPKIRGTIAACENGYHVTLTPAAWWSVGGARCFEVEHDGKVSELVDGEKIACRSIRLLREITDHAELAKLNVFLSGENHVANSEVVFASGSSSVAAFGSASVAAYGSASVTAYGSASVTAYGSASVTASGSASVTAYGSSSVAAYDSASVTAYDSASVAAYDSASVAAYGSASVAAYDSASVTASGSASVTAYGSSSVEASGSASVAAFGSASVAAYGSASVAAYDSASVAAFGSASVAAYGSVVVHQPTTYSWNAPTVQVSGHAVFVDRSTGKPRIYCLASAGAEIVIQEPAEEAK